MHTWPVHTWSVHARPVHARPGRGRAVRHAAVPAPIPAARVTGRVAFREPAPAPGAPIAPGAARKTPGTARIAPGPRTAPVVDAVAALFAEGDFRPAVFDDPGGPGGGAGDDLVGELCRRVLGPLARSDQRRSGELYIRGLLAATGRKSIRNIAAQTGVPADAQRLHHFISDSTWRWRPVRAALAHHVGALAPPLAWVVHTATLPRAGRGGVGVEQFTDPRTGRRVNARCAVGLWAVTAHGACPVDWILRLTPRWLDDPVLRARARLPADAAAVDAVAAGLDMVRATAATAGPHRAPVLLDARHAPAGRVAARLQAGGFPYLLRIAASHPLTPLAADGRDAARVVTARHLAAGPAAGAYGRVRPPGAADGPYDVVRVPCRAYDTPPGPRRRQLLLARRDPYHPERTAYWLTDLTTLPSAALLRLAAAPDGIDRDVSVTGRRHGLHDFDGRTFAGWHRHITLASAAHAAALLLDRRPAVAGPPPPPAPTRRGERSLPRKRP